MKRQININEKAIIAYHVNDVLSLDYYFIISCVNGYFCYDFRHLKNLVCFKYMLYGNIHGILMTAVQNVCGPILFSPVSFHSLGGEFPNH